MAYYSGCNLVVLVPFNYSAKNELIRFLQSKFEGCEIKIEESSTDEPYADTVAVSEGAQLSGLQASTGLMPLGQPAPIKSIAGEFLLRSATDAIEEFTDATQILKTGSQTLRQNVNKILESDPNISLKDALLRLCSRQPNFFGGETAEVQNRMLRLKALGS
jgi:hypothetical protein